MKDQSIADRQSYCDYIDGLRGIAILMVMAVHSGIVCAALQPEYYCIPFVGALLASGARGVQLFFILSAFTLFHSSLKRFKFDRFPRTSFYIRRAFRILPFWWIAVCYYAWFNRVPILNTVPSIFFYFGFIRFDVTKEIVPGGWSLFVEETFYLFLPFVLYFVTGIERAVKFFLLTVSIAVAWVVVAPMVGVPTKNSYIWLSPLTNWFCFALGILAYQLFKEPQPIERFYQSLPKKKYIDVVLLVVILAGIVSRYSAPFVLFLLVCLSRNCRGIFGRVTRMKWLMRYGRYCYSLYLIHFALLDLIKPCFVYIFRYYIHVPICMEIRFVGVYSCLLTLGGLVGYGSFNLIEKPCVNQGKRIIGHLNVRKVTIPIETLA